MKGIHMLLTIGTFGFVYIIMYHAIGIDDFHDIEIGNLDILFLFKVGYGIALSAITSFIIGIVYEYVIKHSENIAYMESVEKNNEIIIKRIPSIVANFDTFWDSLDPRVLKDHLYKLLCKLTKSEGISKQFIKAISSVEGINSSMWEQLCHNIVINEDVEDNVLHVVNTISFKENVLLKKAGNKIFFVMVRDKSCLEKLKELGAKVDHYWVSKIGFDIVKRRLEVPGNKCGFVFAEVSDPSNEIQLGDMRFMREEDLENKMANEALIWSLSYTSSKAGEHSMNVMYRISTYTAEKNPFVFMFLERAATSLDVSLHLNHPHITVQYPKLFLRPNQIPVVSHYDKEVNVKVTDVLLPGHGILFLFNRHN